MKPLYHEEYWSIRIEWSRPKEYSRFLVEPSDNEAFANLYLISARFGRNASKLLYVGQTYDQWVSRRLSQKDHKRRHSEFRENYPHHTLYVSQGIVTVHDGKLTRKRLNDIERVLIYINDPEHAHNVQNFYTHGVSGSYHIENSGSKCTLPRIISLGVFVKY